MMFQFRFLDEENATDNNTESPEPAHLDWFVAKEIHPEMHFVEEVLNTDCISLFKCRNDAIKYITSVKASKMLAEKLQECPVFRAERDDSDLVNGVYEGGLKIWECTYDLTNYIIEKHIYLKNKNVLDLGCGAGIIGILASINGSFVYFQDYNEEIIRYCTIPNVYLNREFSTAGNNVLNKCKFYSGDWSSFLAVTEKYFQTEESKFDYILTCETIYNPQNYKKLHSVFKERLKQNGIIYLAAKTHYFGVGGGLRQFEDFMKKENVFQFSTCWKCLDGLQREILTISFKYSTT